MGTAMQLLDRRMTSNLAKHRKATMASNTSGCLEMVTREEYKEILYKSVCYSLYEVSTYLR